MIIKGKVIKYGDDVNTDVIIPGRYLVYDNYEKLASHAMEDLDLDFLKKFSKGDIIVAGKNFGCGSSREQAAICLKYIGVGAIIAKSFSRIFFRNAINQGLPIIESKQIVESIKEKDQLSINFNKGVIENTTINVDLRFKPLPNFLREIINDGGLVPSLKKSKLIDNNAK